MKQTITTASALFERLEKVQERGYATNREETVEGLGAVSVPINGPDGQTIGALGISGPVNRVLNGDSEYAQLLLDAKKELDLTIRLL
jgi:DNA-binding IclR family transcriptional regulator